MRRAKAVTQTRKLKQAHETVREDKKYHSRVDGLDNTRPARQDEACGRAVRSKHAVSCVDSRQERAVWQMG